MQASSFPLRGQIPPQIDRAKDYEVVARQAIAGPTYEYIAGGSGEGKALAANLAAFSSLTVCPRVLRDVTTGHTRTALGSRVLPHPIMLAPVAFQQLVHPAAELETARAAEASDTCMIVSTLSSRTLEEIAQVSRGEKWFQLYLQPDRNATLELVRRAESAGYGAIVLTVDAAIQVPSNRALRAGFRMPDDVIAANLRDHLQPGLGARAQGSRVLQGLMATAPTMQDLEWLMTQTTLPLWVKGVMHPADARALSAMGIAGLIVSNHGGRGFEDAPATLRVLPTMRQAVGNDFPLLIDGGLRSGTDVFKAIAQGADGVLIGRLQIYALSVAGALGVAHMIKLLREELEICMALTGCATLADVRCATLESA